MKLEDLKEYLRVLHNDEDGVIQSILDASIAYLQGAIDSFDEKYNRSDNFKAKADMVIRVIASELYDNRQYVSHEKYLKVSNIVTSLITQLQLGDYDEN